jgi:hypothetical protein
MNTGDRITLVLAFATTIMAGATVWLGFWARKEAIATVRLGDEAKRDRELAAQPRLSAFWPTSVPFALNENHAITLKNAGAVRLLALAMSGERKTAADWSRLLWTLLRTITSMSIQLTESNPKSLSVF